MSIKNCHWQYLELGRALERETLIVPTQCPPLGSTDPERPILKTRELKERERESLIVPAPLLRSPDPELVRESERERVTYCAHPQLEKERESRLLC